MLCNTCVVMTDTYKPTSGMATAAKRALRWIEDGHAGSGFTSVGRHRASQLAARESLSLDTVKRMYSFFSRHEVDKKGKDFDNLTKPSPGRVAWDAWGGDAGFSWSKQIVESNEKALMTNNASFFARIIKTDKQSDGTLLVTGIATDSSLDSDEQICDGEWLKSAMPNWFRWGNIREQHSNIAAGVAREYQEKDGAHFITAHVVDPASVKKVENGVLKGFSIGIRQPRVVKDDKAAGGRIIDGEIVEVSLVDRPANPICTLSLAKSVDGTMTPVEELIEKAAEETAAEESTEAPPKKEEESSVPAEKKAAAEESSQKPGEESSQAVGEESSREGGVAGVAGKGDCPTCAKMYDMVAKMCDKMFAESNDTNEKSLSEDITKALDERMSVLEKAVSEAKAPVRMVVGTPKPAVNEHMVKAAEYRAKALSASDPRLAQGFLALALEIESTL